MKNIYKTYRLGVLGMVSALGLLIASSPAWAGFEFYPNQSPSLQTPNQPSPQQAQQVPLQPLPSANGPTQLSQPGVFQPSPVQQQSVGPVGSPTPVQSSQLAQSPRSGRFDINPYPINKDSGVSDGGLLYGQPVPTTPDGPVPLYNNSQSYDLSSTTPQSSNLSQPGGEIVQGFGKNLPLALAVQQIIPAGYSYSFQKGVELSSSVTWDGGRAWQTVLTDTLRPLGYAYQVEGDNIIIGRSGSLDIRPSFATPAPVTAQPLNGFEDQGGFQQASVSPVQNYGASTTFMVEGSEDTKENYVQDEVLPVISATAYKDVIKNWSAPQGSSLREILESWSQEVGVDLYWSAEYDYPVRTSVNRTGTYEETVRILLEGLKEAQPRPAARLHPNLPNGPAVLVVNARKALD